MSTWRRMLWFSALITCGLMLGHAAWAAIGVVHTERAMALHSAWFDPNAEFEVEGASRRIAGWLVSHASSLWSIAAGLSSATAWAPGLLLVQFVTSTLVTFAVWAVAHWAVRLVACRGLASLGTSLDLQPSECQTPIWSVVLISPLFAFLAAVGYGLATTLDRQYPTGTPPPGSQGFPPEQVGWTVTAVFAFIAAATWGLRTLRAVRARQQAAHRANESCSRCGYPFGGVSTDRCPECGTPPPPVLNTPPGSRRWPLILAALLLPTLALLTGFVNTGGTPGLIAFALDRNSFVIDAGYTVDVPLRRIILVEGNWGRLYLAGAPVETGETLIRAVLTEDSDKRPPRITAAVIAAANPAGGPPLNTMLAAPFIPTLTRDGLLAWVYNASFADPRSRYVQVSHFAIEP